MVDNSPCGLSAESLCRCFVAEETFTTFLCFKLLNIANPVCSYSNLRGSKNKLSIQCCCAFITSPQTWPPSPSSTFSPKRAYEQCTCLHKHAGDLAQQSIPVSKQLKEASKKEHSGLQVNRRTTIEHGLFSLPSWFRSCTCNRYLLRLARCSNSLRNVGAWPRGRGCVSRSLGPRVLAVVASV